MVPALGESVTEATVSTWFKTVGDAVAQDEMLCELETDKVSVEVPSPAAGTLGEILAAGRRHRLRRRQARRDPPPAPAPAQPPPPRRPSRPSMSRPAPSR